MAVALETRDEARPQTRRAAVWPEIAITAMLAACVLVAHPITQMLRRPYWVDEAWVADLTRVPLSTAFARSSSTPRGWVALLRLVPGSGLQRGRELTLFFAIGTVIATYALVRQFDWPNRFVARVSAAAVALVVCFAPLSLARNDLKQYTGDAFFAIVLLLAGRVVERKRAPAAVAWLGLAVVLAIPFSTVSAFVGAALFVALMTVAMVDREKVRAAVVLLVGVVVALVGGLFFASFVMPGDTPILRRFWNPMYLRGSPVNIVQQAWSNLSHLSHALAMPAIVAVALFAVGIAALFRRRERVIAVTMIVLWIEMFVLGIARRYPFLDQRTSHFLLVPTVLVIAFGVVDTLVRLAKHQPVVALVVAGACAVLFGIGVAPFWRHIGITTENPRTETEYVAQNMGPGDVVLVDSGSNYGFAYYWPHGDVQLVAAPGQYNGFLARVGNAADVVYPPGRTAADLREGLHEALALEDALGQGGRIYVVRAQMRPTDRDAWNAAFVALGLHPHEVTGGADPLLEINS